MTVRPPAHVEPYVRLLGEDLAITFFLACGGSRVYLAEKPGAGGLVLEAVGDAGQAALFHEFGPWIPRVPIPSRWMAARWHEAGVPILEIARRLHVSDNTVRRWLRAPPTRDRPSKGRRAPIGADGRPNQLDLIEWLGKQRPHTA